MKRGPKTAKHRMMDLLARRDHSEKELRTKLADRHTPAEIDGAIEYGRANGWLMENGALSRRFADQLHRRGKGVRAINQKLHKIGLPSVAADPDLELEKALRLAETHLSRKRGGQTGRPDKATKERIGRFLLSRGFEPAIVRKVVYEKL